MISPVGKCAFGAMSMRARALARQAAGRREGEVDQGRPKRFLPLAGFISVQGVTAATSCGLHATVRSIVRYLSVCILLAHQKFFPDPSHPIPPPSPRPLTLFCLVPRKAEAVVADLPTLLSHRGVDIGHMRPKTVRHAPLRWAVATWTSTWAAAASAGSNAPLPYPRRHAL